MRIRVPVRAALKKVAAGSYVDAFETVAFFAEDHPPLVLVALSGGADSLALAAAVAAEAAAAGLRAGAVIVDHGLQAGSAAVAARAASQASALGLDPVLVRRVTVPGGAVVSGSGGSGGSSGGSGGPEAAARTARYEALAAVAAECGAVAVLTAHTRDDQAEQVLLALARGSGTRSIAGIPSQRTMAGAILVIRPLLDEQAGVTREITETSCAELGLEPWHDPHNLDRSFARVRVRVDAMPLLEQKLGRGFAAGLARSADLAREDADALDALAQQHYAAIVRVEGSGGGGDGGCCCGGDCGGSDGGDCGNGGAGDGGDGDGGLCRREDRRAILPVAALLALPAALRGRVIRLVADREFGSQLTREHTLAIASLVTAWKGQGPIHAPQIIVRRDASNIVICSR